MTGVDIDVAVFEFISRLGSIQLNPRKPQPELKGNGAAIELGEVKNFGVQQSNPNDGSVISKYVDVDGTLTGLNEENFAQFKSLVSGLLEQEPFASLADAEFLVNESFTWLINVYKNKNADINLTTHLLNAICAAIVSHRFYFRIEPLEIQESFSVGNVEFMYFDEKDIQPLYEEYLTTNPNTTFERFNEVCEKNFNRVNACVNVKGVFSKAEDEAMRMAELAVDVLKSCCVSHALQFGVQVFDLDYRLQRSMPSFFLTHAGNDLSNLSVQIRNHGQVVPISLTKEKLEELSLRGLPELSDFIRQQKMNNELYDEIIGLIHQLGTVISTSDNYEKVIKAISLLESFLVQKEAAGRAMGQTKLKTVIPKLIVNQKDQESILKYLPVFYNIRDKYLHNYRKLPLNIEHLMFLLNFERVFILKLVRFNKTMSTVKEVHDYLGINNK